MSNILYTNEIQSKGLEIKKKVDQVVAEYNLIKSDLHQEEQHYILATLEIIDMYLEQNMQTTEKTVTAIRARLYLQKNSA